MKLGRKTGFGTFCVSGTPTQGLRRPRDPPPLKRFFSELTLRRDVNVVCVKREVGIDIAVMSAVTSEEICTAQLVE